MRSQVFQRQRIVRMAMAMLLVGGLLSTMTAASPAIAQSSGRAEGSSEPAPRYRTYEFGTGTLEERGDYIHCVTRVTSQEGSDNLIPGRETCFREENEASEFAQAGSAVGAQQQGTDSQPESTLGVHYVDAGFTGASLRAVGPNCASRGLNLRDSVWDNVISSTVNGCSRIGHYDISFYATVRDTGEEIYIPRGDREDTTGIGGNLSDLDNRASAIVYFGQPTIGDTETTPTVNLVGLEVTQGVQNWLGTLDLVRNKQTVVRAFFETPTVGEQVEVTAELRAHTSAGTDLGSRDPVNPGGSVTVSDNVAERRWQLNSSLNFVLPIDWADLDEDESLFLRLDFSNNISVNCQERIVPTESCSANVSFRNVPAPDIVMVPLEVREEFTEKVSGTSEGDLIEQFARINSVMPFSTEKIDSFDVDEFIIANYTFDFKPFSRYVDMNDVNERLLDLRGEVGDGAYYLGVLPGHPLGGLTYGLANDISGEVASFFTAGIDGGMEASAHFGRFRNTGAHELGHLLGQTHTHLRLNRVVEEGPIYDLGCDLQGLGEDNATLYRYFERFVEPRTGQYVDMPVLGPLGDVDTEVWGLDSRYVALSPLANIIFYSEQIDTLAVSNPRKVFSIMGLCHPFREDHEPQVDPQNDLREDTNNQGIWMDSFHHERIINERIEATQNDAVQGNRDTAKVQSDMFSGTVALSSTGAPSSININSIFSRPRLQNPYVSGEYVLELRDASNEIVRSISFAASEGIALILSGTTPSSESRRANFSFVVSDPPEYTSYAITHNNRELLVVERSANAPSVSISGPTAGQIYDSTSNISVSWTGSDADDDELSYRVYYSVDGGTTYKPLSLKTEDTSKAFPASKLEGSNQARIGVSASDGTRSSFAETAIFSVPNHAPDINIQTPFSGDIFAENQGFVLDAIAYDMEDGLVPSSHISWRSSIDGSLGTGRYLVLSAADLSAGSHTITVTATDALGLSASDSVNVVISLRNALPVANNDNFQVSADEEALIDVLANDVDVEGDVDLSSFRIVQPPQMGFAQKVRTQDGVRIKYYSNTSGRDHFIYIICDAVDRCDTARVSIDVGLADCTILGTEADDVIEGTSGDDVICALGGDDTIDAKGGDDIIRGGLGDDTIYARAGNDVVYGEIGNDFILGHNGADTIHGGLDDDTIYGGGDADMIFGGHGQDELYGEADNDTIEGGDGSDTIHGGRGDDTIRGGNGDDTIRGNAGADTIEPGTGTDTLLGISPEDTVTETD